MFPLSYVLRDVAAVPVPAPALEVRLPYSTLHGSVTAEMVARFSHVNTLFSTDNASFFDDIEEATRGSNYSVTITPLQAGQEWTWRVHGSKGVAYRACDVGQEEDYSNGIPVVKEIHRDDIHDP